MQHNEALVEIFLLNALLGIVNKFGEVVSMDNLVEANKAMDDVMSAGVMVKWLDQILQRIHEDRECQLMYHKVATFKTQFKEAKAYLHQSNNLLKHHEKKPSYTLMTNYYIKIL